MTGIILGVVFILFGVVAGAVAFLALNMADRRVTWAEGVGVPLLWFCPPILLGVVLIVLR